MPKVTAQHVETRKAQILNAAGVCFAEKGFQRTTMKDICRRAGLSAGAVYAYFPGKEDLIRALIAENARKNEIEFKRLAEFDTLREALEEFLRLLLLFDACDTHRVSPDLDAYKLKVALWAECVRSPGILGSIDDVYSLAIRELQKITRRARRRGELREGVDTKVVAQTLIALLEGFVVQQAVVGGRLGTKKYIDGVVSMLEGGLLRRTRP